MSAVTVDDIASTGAGDERTSWRLPGPLSLWMMAAAIASVSIARLITHNDDITSASTFGTAIRTAAPIALAGLGGLYAERSGTVNIGLEGMMIMGTVFAGWWAWEINPWMGLVGGVVGGMLGGLLHAVATATFGVNHIVSGFAINIIAPGVARFMANLLFVGEQGGSLTNSPGMKGEMGVFTMPLLSGGSLFGIDSTWDPLGNLAERHWFAVSDVAGLLKALTTELRFDIVVAIVLFVVSIYVLWRTPFGLRLRSAGERPSAADSLGVKVVMYRYIGMAISGGLAGLAGAVLAIGANRYTQGQTGGRGFLGLATLVVGNWRPAGVAAGAGLFGFFDGITQRLDPGKLVLTAMLAAVILLVAFLAYVVVKQPSSLAVVALVAFAGVLLYLLFQVEGKGLVAVVLAGLAVVLAAATILAVRLRTLDALAVAFGLAVLYVVFLSVDDVRPEFVFMAPFIVTLIVVASRGQTLRPPARAGIPWRKGSQGG